VTDDPCLYCGSRGVTEDHEPACRERHEERRDLALLAGRSRALLPSRPVTDVQVWDLYEHYRSTGVTPAFGAVRTLLDLGWRP
jgi:hypothetical protein